MNPKFASGTTAETLKWRQLVVDVLTHRTHPQNGWLWPSAFQQMVKKRGLGTGIGTSRLEGWDKMGIFHPLIRYRYPVTTHRKSNDGRGWEAEPFEGDIGNGSDFIAVTHNDWRPEHINKPYYANTTEELVSIGTTKNYVPWKGYESINDFGRTDWGGVYYHPFQIFRLRAVVRACEIACTFTEFKAIKGTRKFFQQDLNIGRRSLIKCELFHLKTLYLLAMIEDRYLPIWRGGRHGLRIRGNLDKDVASTWHEWARDFDATATLSKCDLTIDEIQEIRGDLSWQGQCLDPNSSFYLLFRHFPHDQRQRLEGDALLAWDYYEASEMIGWFLKDATGEKQPATDDLNRSSGHWKKVAYGVEADEISYDSGNILRPLLNELTVDPVYKVLLILEGESEEAFIKSWCNLRHIDLLIEGIQILVLGGQGALKPEMVRQAVQRARADRAATIAVVDNDPPPHKPRANLQALIDEGLVGEFFTIPDLYDDNRPIGALVWDSNFEEDNFTHDEIIQAYLMLVAEERTGWKVDVDALKTEIQQLQRNPKFNNWMYALETATKRLTYPVASKTKVAKYLPRVLGDKENHMIRVLRNCIHIALMATNYGPPRRDGGFGYDINISDRSEM